MKRILIALDYDPSAQKVAETGLSFAKAMKAEITLLHVLANQQDYKLTASLNK
jgi:nucleotide-binding universal stress UspA family protein